MKIVTFGEIMLRLSKHGAMRLTQGNSFDANYGGSEANVAVSLAMLGDDVKYVTRVPDNAIGEAALMHLREYGVDVRHSVKGGKRLGTYYFEPSAAMRLSRVVYDRDDSAFNTLSFGDIDWAPILKEVGLFHCSGITCATSQAALDTTMDAVRRAFESGVELTCDINYRGNLWKYPGANARKALDELMQYSSFIFGDQNEWYVASGLDPIPFTALDESYQFDLDAYRRYFDRLHKMFPRAERMLMAHRNQLSFQHHVNAGVLWVNGEIYTSRICDIQPIVDQMGVGDAWVAAFIHARHRWPDDDRLCLEFSTAAASLKNTVPGDQNLVSEQEILAAMQGGNGRIDR
uniref:sugar kinase n=1 Tax=Prevotella sp. TaxID=59823 RepID=UPI0040264973